MRDSQHLFRDWSLAPQAVLLVLAAYTFVLVGGFFFGWNVAKHRVEAAWLIFAGIGWMVASWNAFSGPRLPVHPEGQRVGSVGWIWLCGLTALSLVLYAPALSLGFLSDDFVLFSRATRGEFWSPGTTQFLRPVPLAAWAALAAMPVPPAVALHALNVVLHGVNSTLVAALAARLGFRRLTATAAGLLFLCFPAAVEPVAWAAGIQDVLLTSACLVFVLSCFSPSLSRGIVLGSSALLVALGTKETAVAVPLIGFLFVWVRAHPFRWRWQVPATGLLLTLGYVAWRAAAVGIPADHAVAPSRYFLKELLSRVFGTLAVPFTEGELLRQPFLGAFLALMLLVLVLVASWRWRTERATFIVANRLVLWVLLSVAPVWSMFFVSSDLRGSRYVYLAACGWSILVAVLFIDTTSRRWRLAARSGLAALLVVSLVGVRLHLAEWNRAAQLRDSVLAKAVDAVRSHNCGSVSFSNLPESIGGAYVFGNGLTEAVGLALGRPTPPVTMGANSARCSMLWDGKTFQVQ